jgi:hypothetical protein
MIATALTSKTTFQPLESEAQIPLDVQQASAEAVAIAYRMMKLSNQSTWMSNLFKVERLNNELRLETPTGEPLIQGKVTSASDRLDLTLDLENGMPNSSQAIASFTQLKTESIAHLAQALVQQLGTADPDGTLMYATSDYAISRTETHLSIDHSDRGRILESFGTTVVLPPQMPRYEDFERLWEATELLPETEWQTPSPLYSMSTVDLADHKPWINEPGHNLEPDSAVITFQTDWAGADIPPDAPPAVSPSELKAPLDLSSLEVHRPFGAETEVEDQFVLPSTGLELPPPTEIEEIRATSDIVEQTQPDAVTPVDALQNSGLPQNEALVEVPGEPPPLIEITEGSESAIGGDSVSAGSGIHEAVNVDEFIVVQFDRRLEGYIAQPVVNVAASNPMQDRLSEVDAVPVASVSPDVATALQAARLAVTSLGTQEGDCTIFSGTHYRIELRDDDLRVFAEGRGEILTMTEGNVLHSLNAEDRVLFGAALITLQSQTTNTHVPVVHLEPGWANEES